MKKIMKIVIIVIIMIIIILIVIIITFSHLQLTHCVTRRNIYITKHYFEK